MSLLGKYTEQKENRIRRSQYSDKGFVMPAVTRDDKDDSLSLKKCLVISAILHPAVIGAIWLILLICALLGINLSIFDKPKPKVNDIEFVLVDKEDTPRDLNTRNRADMNSRSGGINNPKLPVSMPSSQAKPSSRPAGGGAPKAQKPKHEQPKSLMERVKQSVSKPHQSVTTTQKNVTPSVTPTPAVPKPEIAKPQPPTARPSIKPPTTPKAVQKPTNSPFKVPVPSGGTTSGQFATGPISGSGSSNNGGSKGSGNYSPNPSLAPIGNGSGSNSKGSGTGTGAGRGTGSGGHTGSGGGNPGGGGGRPGIDAIREPDFGPYMRELQRRIKMNWDPPKGNESKRVVLLFKIAKDGRLLSCSVFKSSGLQNADAAALNAVKLAAPFRPLPPEFKGQSIDIQFTFDYNVFGATKY
ncbi:TonB family protein [bacterium]|nr:TonB family protein [bacterium]